MMNSAGLGGVRGRQHVAVAGRARLLNGRGHRARLRHRTARQQPGRHFALQHGDDHRRNSTVSTSLQLVHY